MTPGTALPYFDDEASVRRSDPETSVEAARSISRERLSAAKRTVINTFKLARRALTDEELIAEARRHFPATRLTDSSIRTRRRELQRRGLIEHDGYGLTRSGRRCRKFSLANGSAP